MPFLIGKSLYVLTDSALVKTSSGEQLSLFDSGKHPRDRLGRFISNPAVQNAIHWYADQSEAINEGKYTVQHVPDEPEVNADPDGNLGYHLASRLIDALPDATDDEHEALLDHIIDSYGDRRSAHAAFPETSPFVESAFDRKLVNVPTAVRDWYHGYMNDPFFETDASEEEKGDRLEEWNEKLYDLAGGDFDQFERWSIDLGLA